jgi:hypothetical protein
MLGESNVCPLFMNGDLLASGVGEKTFWRRGEEMQIDVGLEALQGRQNSGGPRGVPQPVWRDETGYAPIA